jgi:hypothetical protein
MKNNYKGLIIKRIVLVLLILTAGIIKSKAQTTITYTYTGAMQTFTVPNCVNVLSFTVSGAQGQANNPQTVVGGLGGSAYGSMTVTPGNVLNIFVGGLAGYNGGGAAGTSACTTAQGGSGGGGSDIRVGGTALSNRVIVGGGGGGAGGDRIASCGRGTGGGGGGGYYGGGGGAGWGSATVPTGGTQTTGGTGGTSSSTTNGFNGALGIGGAGGTEVSSSQTGGAVALTGGVGGGLTGGVGQFSQTWTGQSGGGGSSYVGPTLTNTSTTSGNRSGDGIVIISYNLITPMTTAGSFPPHICTGQTATLSASGMSSYTWTPGGPGQITVSPGSTTNYTVAGTNTLGCSQLSIITVTVNSSPPNINISSSSTSVCPNNTVMLTATGANTFSWTGGVSNGVAFTPPATSGFTVTGANGCGTLTSATTISVIPLPILGIAQPTLVCAANPATLTAGGATNYTWMPGFLSGASVVVNPTVATTYSVYGVTGSCSGTTSINLSVNPNPTVTATASSSNICEGTSVTLSAIGGNNYTWTPGGMTAQSIMVTPNTSTVYTATGDNSFGCTAAANVILVVIPAPPVTAGTNKSLICVGNSATLTANGANTYQWNTGPTNSMIVVSPGVNTTYSVIGTNTTTGCTKMQTVSVNVFTVNVNVTGPVALCAGASTNLTAFGANTYTWSTGNTGANLFVTPPSTTVYIVNATTNTLGMACASSNTVNVTVNSLPNVTAAATRTSICKNESSTLTANGASTYTWSNFNTAPTFTLKGTSNITYNFTVTGTDNNGCINTATAAVKVNPCTSLEEYTFDANVDVYPNPSTGKFTVFIKEPAKQSIQVYNITGALIKTEDVSSQATTIDLDQEMKGLYFIRIVEGDRTVQTVRVVKN